MATADTIQLPSLGAALPKWTAVATRTGQQLVTGLFPRIKFAAFLYRT